MNGFIKPIIKLFSLPLTLATLGLFGLVINAGAAAAHRVDREPRRASTFTVGGFPPDFGLDAIGAAFIGGIAITIVGSHRRRIVVHD